MLTTFCRYDNARQAFLSKRLGYRRNKCLEKSWIFRRICRVCPMVASSRPRSRSNSILRRWTGDSGWLSLANFTYKLWKRSIFWSCFRIFHKKFQCSCNSGSGNQNSLKSQLRLLQVIHQNLLSSHSYLRAIHPPDRWRNRKIKESVWRFPGKLLEWNKLVWVQEFRWFIARIQGACEPWWRGSEDDVFRSGVWWDTVIHARWETGRWIPARVFRDHKTGYRIRPCTRECMGRS